MSRTNHGIDTGALDQEFCRGLVVRRHEEDRENSACEQTPEGKDYGTLVPEANGHQISRGERIGALSVFCQIILRRHKYCPRSPYGNSNGTNAPKLEPGINALY